MSQANPYQAFDSSVVAHATDQERVTFIRRTYAHLAAAVMGFIVLECVAFMLTSEASRISIMKTMMGTRWTWFAVLGCFMLVSWVADKWAASATSLSTQYLGLGVGVTAWAVLFSPLLFFAEARAPGAIESAALITAVVFGGLTAFVFATKSDLSGMGKYLALAGMGALGYIVFAAIFPQSLGLGSVFSCLMIVLACGYILYDTSNVLHRYRTTQYVAASLALFASVALLFWYILRMVIAMSSND